MSFCPRSGGLASRSTLEIWAIPQNSQENAPSKKAETGLPSHLPSAQSGSLIAKKQKLQPQAVCSQNRTEEFASEEGGSILDSGSSSWCSCFASKDCLTQNAWGVTEPVTDLQITGDNLCNHMLLLFFVRTGTVNIYVHKGKKLQRVVCDSANSLHTRLLQMQQTCRGFHCSRVVVLLATFLSVFWMLF